jgi:Domain of unknown function (DUF4382)
VKIEAKALAYGVAGLALAGLVVFSGSALGLLPVGTTGVISIMLTDPPTVPNGVSAVFVNYSSVAVHAEGLGNSSGWVPVAGQGTVDTLGLVNLSQTISSGRIPSLTYNLVRFSISGVLVEFDGKNYSAAVHSGNLIVPIPGGLKVNSSGASAALIDILPTVVNLGDQGSPHFALAAAARALQVPSKDLDERTAQIGQRTSLTNRSWFRSFESDHQTNLMVSQMSLSPSSLSFSATNGGSQPLTITLITLTPASSGEKPSSALGPITYSVVFLVEPDGTLELQNGPPGQAMSSTSVGYTLAPGSTQGFSYSGTITTLLSKAGITTGGSYYVVVFGSEASITQTAVAA